jgi:hypothetical protein
MTGTPAGCWSGCAGGAPPPTPLTRRSRTRFLAVWRHAGSYRGGGEVAAFIWGIAIRQLLTAIRAERRAAGRALGAVRLATDTAHADPAVASAEEVVLLAIEHGPLGDVLARLSPELRPMSPGGYCSSALWRSRPPPGRSATPGCVCTLFAVATRWSAVAARLSAVDTLLSAIATLLAAIDTVPFPANTRPSPAAAWASERMAKALLRQTSGGSAQACSGGG